MQSTNVKGINDSLMTHKDQNKVLDNKIEPNINQYKVDRLNADISALTSGDLNKYEFLTNQMHLIKRDLNFLL